MKNNNQLDRRLAAARDLLAEPQFNRGTFNSFSTIIKGINPKLDKKFEATAAAWKKVDLIKETKVIDLAIEDLPEKTVAQKKRKKALILFLKNWRELKSEIKRVQTELGEQSQIADSTTKLQSTGRMIGLAKGPLGLITGLAVLITAGALWLKANAVEVAIVNQDCGTMTPSQFSNYSLPGLQLPSEPIAAGEQGLAELPPIAFNINLSTNRALVSALFLNLTFELPDSNTQLYFDGQLLNDQQTGLDLSTQKNHQLIIKCQ